MVGKKQGSGNQLDREVCDIIRRLHVRFDSNEVEDNEEKGDLRVSKTAKATGLSEEIIKDIILKDPLTIDLTLLYDNEKYGYMSKGFNDLILRYDEFTFQTIFHIVYDLLKGKTLYPKTINGLQDLLASVGYVFDQNYIKPLLKKIGFRFKHNKLFEKQERRLQRIMYLEEIEKLRWENCHIVYLYVNEMVLDEKTYVLTHAVENGTVKSLAIRELDKDESADYEFVVGTRRGSWFETCLLPKLQQESVVLVFSEEHYRRCFDYAPHRLSNAKELQKWLSDYGISFNSSLSQPELLELVRQHKEDYFQIEYGIKVLRVPRYHPGLNPMESLWKDIRNKLKKDKTVSCNQGHLKIIDRKMVPSELIWYLSSSMQNEKSLLTLEDEIDKLDHELDGSLKLEDQAGTSFLVAIQD